MCFMPGRIPSTTTIYSKRGRSIQDVFERAVNIGPEAAQTSQTCDVVGSAGMKSSKGDHGFLGIGGHEPWNGRIEHLAGIRGPRSIQTLSRELGDLSGLHRLAGGSCESSTSDLSISVSTAPGAME